SITVNNALPKITLNGPEIVDEGPTPQHYTFTVNDAGLDDAIFLSSLSVSDPTKAAISGQTFSGRSGSFDVTFSNDTQDSDNIRIQLAVRDSDSGVGSVTKEVIVNNVAPVVHAGNDATISEGLFHRDISFDDPGDDSWSATIDYGD